ncbi:delta1-pyrroline-5-carboxylate synthase 1 [Striga asiatica]|uniref:Delta1-pyrroline-5-carboxylate synthase 1 n=1 Tax=Striga asiatica TaxID=4170 RepID=A0A5A7RE97_STRAF|nr:delta1-pyrroline-5-carboxylate synthase 1 [Striga asiatica]
MAADVEIFSGNEKRNGCGDKQEHEQYDLCSSFHGFSKEYRGPTVGKRLWPGIDGRIALGFVSLYGLILVRWVERGYEVLFGSREVVEKRVGFEEGTTVGMRFICIGIMARRGGKENF